MLFQSGAGPSTEAEITLPPLKPSAAPRNLQGEAVWVPDMDRNRVAIQLTWDEMDPATLNGPLTKYAIYSRDSTIESSKYDTYYETNITSTSTIFYVQQDQLQHRYLLCFTLPSSPVRFVLVEYL